MSNFTDYDITEAMIKFGGGFVQQLGRLYRQADFDNKNRLLKAFPEYWEKYKVLALFQSENKNNDINE